MRAESNKISLSFFGAFPENHYLRTVYWICDRFLIFMNIYILFITMLQNEGIYPIFLYFELKLRYKMELLHESYYVYKINYQIGFFREVS